MADEVHQALYAQTQAIHQEKVRRYVRAIFSPGFGMVPPPTKAGNEAL